MNTAVVVPFTTDCPHRLRAWTWVQARYRATVSDWQIVTGTHRGPWNKALAVADALDKTDADLLIVADADVWCEELPEFVARVANGSLEWASPHRRIVRLTQDATERVFADGPPDTMPTREMLTERVYDGMIGGGIVILPRTLYERVPLDPRFVGWGGEDESWGRALLTMTQRRTQGKWLLWHFWHPPAQRLTRRVGSEENDALRERYQQAAGHPEMTEAILEEARACHSQTSSSEL